MHFVSVCFFYENEKTNNNNNHIFFVPTCFVVSARWT